MDEKQRELELQKWFDSEKAGKDTCGSYDYCKNCDKSLVDPCANAYAKSAPKTVCKKSATKVATTKKATTAKKTTTKTTTTKTTAKK